MSLTTRADWEQAGEPEMCWRLTMAEPPATFAVCRHYSGWMKMFRLFLGSCGPTGHLEFLEAVDELRQWEPDAFMTRAIYDRYVTGERDGGYKQITLSGPVRAALAGAFSVVRTPDRAAVFAAAYREVMDRVNEGSYRDFLQMAEGVRAGAAV
jgi:hypothetical protein